MKKVIIGLMVMSLSACTTIVFDKEIKEKDAIDKYIIKKDVLNKDVDKIDYRLKDSKDNIIGLVKINEYKECNRDILIGDVKKKSDKCINKASIHIENTTENIFKCNIITKSRIIMINKEVKDFYTRDLILNEKENKLDIKVSCI